VRERGDHAGMGALWTPKWGMGEVEKTGKERRLWLVKLRHYGSGEGDFMFYIGK